MFFINAIDIFFIIGYNEKYLYKKYVGKEIFYERRNQKI